MMRYRAKDYGSDVLIAAGSVLLVYGLYRVWEPLALIASGTIAIAIGMIISRRR